MLQVREIVRARNAPYVRVPFYPMISDGERLVASTLVGGKLRPPVEVLVRVDGGHQGRIYVAGVTWWNTRFSECINPKVPVLYNEGTTVDGSLQPHVWWVALPSVTTILDAVIESPELDQWRDSIGHEEADQIAQEAADQGTIVHELCERYLKGEIVDSTHPLLLTYPQPAVTLFHLIRQELSRLNATVGIEQRLVDIKHGFAGTVDVLCVREGRIAVLDIKTYRKKRSRDQLEKAFLQMAMYALATETNFDGKFIAEDLVVVYANPESGLQVEVAPYSEYRQRAIDMIDLYHTNYPIEEPEWETIDVSTAVQP